MGATAMLLEPDVCPPRRACERLLDITVGLAELELTIARMAAMCERGAGLEGLPAIGDRRQRLVIDGDEGCRVFGDITCLCDHDGDRFTHEGDLVLGENEGRDIRRELSRTELQRQALLGEQR